jgi:polysaccharide export outer membrane protein
VPYAGAIRAQGRTPAEVQAAIVAALKDRALEPQAVVTLADQRASLMGLDHSASPQVRAESASSTRLHARGLRSPGYDLWVVLERNGRRETVPFGAPIYEPQK